ncbi:hypothetical protein TRSC58_07469 [Trypanosoma rangeli SC58]|uniref:Transmembrane protein n=1 Tax=Trypanosoma rangeli SC58 TaxID=429131 RepID=A0A061IRY4_TRYRA|nr:hypothetical protein TRSC58_07469 [Trypanosoma rangeli SC58]
MGQAVEGRLTQQFVSIAKIVLHWYFFASTTQFIVCLFFLPQLCFQQSRLVLVFFFFALLRAFLFSAIIWWEVLGPTVSHKRVVVLKTFYLGRSIFLPPRAFIGRGMDGKKASAFVCVCVCVCE